MSTKKRKFTAEFKARAALEALRNDSTINELASKYSIHTTQINRWKQAALLFIKEGFSNKDQRMSQDNQELIAELYRQIGEMKCENDFLKKNV